MGTKGEEFIDEGLQHYPSAMLAVQRFETIVRDSLAHGLSARAVPGSKVAYARGRNPVHIQASRRIRINSGTEVKASVAVEWDEGAAYLWAYCEDGPPWAVSPEGSHFTRTAGTVYFVETDDGPEFPLSERIERFVEDWIAALAPASRGRKK